MEFGFAFAAESAQPIPDGRFSVLGGGLDGYIAPSLPIIARSLALIVELRFKHDECGRKHSLKMQVMGPGGNKVQELDNIALAPEPDPHFPEHPMNLHVVINLINLVFDSTGFYKFVFISSDKTIGVMEFGIALAEPKADPGA